MSHLSYSQNRLLGSSPMNLLLATGVVGPTGVVGHSFQLLDPERHWFTAVLNSAGQEDILTASWSSDFLETEDKDEVQALALSRGWGQPNRDSL